MEVYIFDLTNLMVRWFHMIAGIAWIGSSFYFVMLDTSLKRPKAKDEKRGVFGELWAVHGGGFYHSQKFLTGPKGEPLSDDLHWSKWEAYTTWISGIFLFILLYWFKAEIYLIDPSVMELSKASAILISLAFLVGGWLFYDLLCRTPLINKTNLFSLILFLFVTVVAVVLTSIFSGRGAYILFGAMLGTMMVGNVFFWIIPGQKKMVAAIRNGQEPNPLDGLRGKQRSVHNTYFTLPVLFTMISNHFAMTYGHDYNALVLMLISITGVLIRVYFVSRHTGSPKISALAVALLLAITSIAVIVYVKGPSQTSQSEINQTASNQTASSVSEQFNRVSAIIKHRCMACHSVNPTQPGFVAPPKGILFETTEQINAQAQQIHQVSVVTRTMPIGNLTQMTESERQQIAEWFKHR